MPGEETNPGTAAWVAGGADGDLQGRTQPPAATGAAAKVCPRGTHGNAIGSTGANRGQPLLLCARRRNARARPRSARGSGRPGGRPLLDPNSCHPGRPNPHINPVSVRHSHPKKWEWVGFSGNVGCCLLSTVPWFTEPTTLSPPPLLQRLTMSGAPRRVVMRLSTQSGPRVPVPRRWCTAVFTTTRPTTLLRCAIVSCCVWLAWAIGTGERHWRMCDHSQKVKRRWCFVSVQICCLLYTLLYNTTQRCFKNILSRPHQMEPALKRQRLR